MQTHSLMLHWEKTGSARTLSYYPPPITTHYFQRSDDVRRTAVRQSLIAPLPDRQTK